MIIWNNNGCNRPEEIEPITPEEQKILFSIVRDTASAGHPTVTEALRKLIITVGCFQPDTEAFFNDFKELEDKIKFFELIKL